MKKIVLLSLLLIVCVSVSSQQLAFPGAEGFGRYAKGVRAAEEKEVYHVTSLADEGPGTLRDAVSKPGRVVVFDKAGVIQLKSRLVFSPHSIIAGQTAPYPGITVYGNGVSFTGADDIIVMHMRFRMGVNGNKGQDAASLATGKNMIFDHVSVSWGLDENFSVSTGRNSEDPKNITIQNSIIGQGLEGHSCGGLIQTPGGVSLIRNLYIDNKTRNPKVKGQNQFINNVVYNWGGGGAYIMGGSASDSWAEIKENYFIKGPSSGNTEAFTRATPTFQTYQKNNLLDYNLNGKLDGKSAVMSDYGDAALVESVEMFKNLPQPFPQVKGLMSAKVACKWIIKNAGASIPARDQVDVLLIDQLKSFGKEGQLIRNENSLGINILQNQSSEKMNEMDSDKDGMSDKWEKKNGLNPNDPNDALQLAKNGYLNIENYIHQISK